MKYAWLVTTNDTYLPSVNAMLNALEYYDYPPELDVHVIHTPEISEYLNYIKEDFTFKVIPVPVEPLVQKTTPAHSLPHNLIYAKYLHAWNIQNDYDAILHIDGDCLILDNFMKQFEVAAKTDLIPCALFPHTEVTIEDYNLEKPDQVHIYTPLANFPIFYNPCRYGDIMKAIWNTQPDELKDSDPLRNQEMYYFNKALYEFGAMNKIVQLPGNLWVADAFVGHTPIVMRYSSKKWALFNVTNDRVQIIHNKWWKPGHAEGEISRSLNKELCQANIDKMMTVFNFFTNECQPQTAKENTWKR